ncbi:Qa-SNARE 3 [Giardia muris]|uniref:Qa-SNARE 3 n=1 Tax=Giardia muris TaxID=5742 RepID=A0A4Z1SRR1_GIAMU|nr:Qa-SNARE 3 [Giardia muris]|eukprot:TNJ28430.1 Qa-SNARE 3 [Giardia muris]
MEDFEAPVFDATRLRGEEDVFEREDGASRNLGRFFKALDDLDKYFKQVAEAIDVLKASSDHVTTSFMGDVNSERRSDAARKMGREAINELSSRIKALNETVREEKEAEDRDASAEERGKYSDELRQKMDRLHAATKKLHSYSSEFQSCQAVSKAVQEQKVKRILKSLRNDLTEQEIDFAVDNGEQAIRSLMQMQTDDSQQLLQEAIEKNNIVKDIQTMALEIHTLTKDAALLCEQQSKLIERIETNVAQARSNVKEGTEHLVKAEQHLKKGNKCMCCIIVFSILGLAVLVMIVSLVLKGKKK